MKHDLPDDLDSLLAPALRPAAGNRDERLQKLLQRAGASRLRHQAFTTVRRNATPWRDLMKGLRGRDLHSTADGSSVLLMLAPGAVLPMHRHRHLEEGIVLAGRMQMGELDLGPGDYHVSFPGSRHDRITSADGCVTYLRGTSLGNLFGLAVELLGGLTPGNGAEPLTIREADGEWHPVAAGVVEKRLWQADGSQSRFLRLTAGSRYRPATYRGECEFMMIAGEAFFGDILLRQEEWQLAPAGTQHDEISSDCGATIFVHERMTASAR